MRQYKPAPTKQAALAALFGDTSTPARRPEDTVLKVPLARVLPNPGQPRTSTSLSDDAELNASVREHGILEPLLCTPNPDGTFTIISGYRRHKAATAAGLTEVPVVVRPATQEQSELYALVTNLQRADLHPVDTIRAVAALYARLGSHEAVARQLGWTEQQVKHWARLRHIPSRILDERRRDPQVTFRQLRDEYEANYKLRAEVSSRGNSTPLLDEIVAAPSPEPPRYPSLNAPSRTLTVPPAQSLARLAPALSPTFHAINTEVSDTEVYEPVVKRLPLNLALRDWSYLYQPQGQSVCRISLQWTNNTTATTDDAIRALESWLGILYQMKQKELEG